MNRFVFFSFFLLSTTLKAQYVQWAQASYDGHRSTGIFSQAIDTSNNQIYLEVQRDCMGCDSKFSLNKVSKANSFRWSYIFPNGNEEVFPRKIATDIAGNVYVIGVYYNGTFTVDLTHSLSSTSSNAPFLIKFNQYGTVKWAVNLNNEALDLTVDKFGFVYLTGSGFTSGYYPTGVLRWTNFAYFGHSIAVDNTNKIVIADTNRIIRMNTMAALIWVKDSMGGAKVDVDTLGRTYVLSPSGVSRLSSAGVVSWTNSSITGSDFDVDAAGNFYVVNSSGLSKYGASGALRWSFASQNLFSVRCSKTGEAYLVGAFNNDFQFNLSPFALDPNTYPSGYMGATCPFRARVNGYGHPAQLKINYIYSDAYLFANAIQPSFCQGNELIKNGFDIASGNNIFYQVVINSAGVFNSGNQFTYEISSSATFTNPIVLPGAVIPLTVAPGNYYLRVVSSSPALTSNTIYFAVGANPLPAITANGPTTFCNGNSVDLTVSYPDLSVYYYEWSKNGNFYDIGETVNVSEAGDYTVLPMNPDNAGCYVKFSSLPTQVTVPCRRGEKDFAPVVYPNPSAKNFTLTFSDESNTRMVVVQDVNGRVVMVFPAFSRAIEFGDNLMPGIYFAHINGESKIESIKIVKTN